MDGRAPARAAAAVAAATGAAALAVEFSAVRLLAPWFGQASVVWANALAVVLLALALGQAIGGALATSPRAVERVRVGLGLAAAWLVLASRAGPLLAAHVAPIAEAGDRAIALSTLGSLASTAILFGPPVIALGAAGPVWIHRLALDRASGRAAGVVLAAGTVGSIAGTYLTPLVSLPALGARHTVDAAALLVALAGLVGTRSREAGAPPPPAAAEPPLGPRRAALAPGLLAAVVGLAVTGSEFAAVRALAPAFGQSQLIWANVIGVILLGLAAGNAVGGRLAGRGDKEGLAGAGGGAPASRALPIALAFGAAWVALAAWLHPSVAAVTAPRGGSGPGAVLGGSLVATLVAFGIPMAALGASSPVLVARLARVRGSGRAAGSVLLAGTVGSVAGCYLAPLASLPEVGTRATLAGCAGLLAVGAASAVGWGRRASALGASA